MAVVAEPSIYTSPRPRPFPYPKTPTKEMEHITPMPPPYTTDSNGSKCCCTIS